MVLKLVFVEEASDLTGHCTDATGDHRVLTVLPEVIFPRIGGGNMMLSPFILSSVPCPEWLNTVREAILGEDLTDMAGEDKLVGRIPRG